MEIQALKEKVLIAKEKVEKCKKTIERHKLQLEKKIAAGDDWGIRSKNDDIKGAEKKLRSAEITLENWESKLSLEVEKERFLNDHAPQVIKDFLEDWKSKVFDWHIKKYESYQVFKKELEEEVKIAKVTSGFSDSEWRKREEYLKEKELDWKSIANKKAGFAGQIVLYMDSISNVTERLTWLDKTLEQDKKFKMLDLINRINKVVGTITDATHLKISTIGNLNGIIIGEKGTAKVETISAGGFHIQCFHFRTLIHKSKSLVV